MAEEYTLDDLLDIVEGGQWRSVFPGHDIPIGFEIGPSEIHHPEEAHGDQEPQAPSAASLYRFRFSGQVDGLDIRPPFG